MHLPKFWYLRDLRIDERLPSDVLDTLRQRARLERWGHRADIFRSPDDADVSVVLEGNVWLQDRSRADEVGLGRGDIFGKANGELDHKDLILRAHDDTLLAVVSPEEFRQMVTPHLGRLQTKVGMFHKRRDLWVPVQPLLFTTPKCRLAKVLLHLVETEGSVDDDGRGLLGMRLQPRKLADLTGVNPQRVKRILASLETDKILELGRSGTRVWDLDELRRIAQSG
ncbi:Crp/Fnr family transcriptional regulator [Persicimonas caeni]|uniref:Crp/Fnr family transcriptional regulator n=1 Tax=Persicimonas caeni TaxID=2292766 RepID=A0A4Y6PYW5_PERCE|nr:helix-turn-helix domain-containing protein [Persicimonas caeni]QDG53349.1 Crp/Fnr family transcriptional regulator [Persicimonas caeni]QED34570.1 Crp/Fnr family transcriptional regulator [Persicimonas caeni]